MSEEGTTDPAPALPEIDLDELADRIAEKLAPRVIGRLDRVLVVLERGLAVLERALVQAVEPPRDG